MKGWVLRAVAAAVVLQPALAHAQWSLRLALEAPFYSHVSVDGVNTSTSVADTFQPGIDLLGGYAIADSLSFDLEFRTGLFATGPYPRVRTTLGPGFTLDPLGFPLYARLAFPIQVESEVALFFRIGGGLKFFDVGFIRAYVEVTVDFACAGNGVGFFGRQTVNAALGVWLRI